MLIKNYYKVNYLNNINRMNFIKDYKIINIKQKF